MGQQDQAVRPTGTLALPRPNPPQRILEGAENCLRSNAYLALKNVTCDYHEGVLTLRGCLPTYYLKQIAQTAVARVAGGARIVNEIEVVSPSYR
jgi:osmotically-inducible protein OsmY